MTPETLRAIARLEKECPANVFPEFAPPLPEMVVVLEEMGTLEIIKNHRGTEVGYIITTPTGDKLRFESSSGFNAQHNLRQKVWKHLLTRAGYLHEPISA